MFQLKRSLFWLMRYHFRLLASTFSLILVLNSSLAADIVNSFSASGTFTDSTSFSGTFSVDITSGVVTAADLTYQGTDFSTLSFVPAAPPGFVVTTSPSAFVPQIALVFVGTSNPNPLIGYGGGSICSTTNLCPVPGTGGDTLSGFFPASGPEMFLQSGSITPTPEPSSLLLLGTGLIGGIGAMRSRFLK